jgi:hypothetical protein
MVIVMKIPVFLKMMWCSLIDNYMVWWNVVPPRSALNLEAGCFSKRSVNTYQTKHHCIQKTVILNHPVHNNLKLSTYFYFLMCTTNTVV